MATEFNTEADLIAALTAKFGAEHIGTPVEETCRYPYYNHIGATWVINDSCLDKLYKIYVRDISGIDETTLGKEVYYSKSKTTGKCWYLGRAPRQEGSPDTFLYEVLEYFKQFLPGFYAPQIISLHEYFNGDKEKSTALIVIMTNTDTLGIYKIYYNGGVIAREDITASYEDVLKYMTLYKGE